MTENKKEEYQKFLKFYFENKKKGIKSDKLDKREVKFSLNLV